MNEKLAKLLKNFSLVITSNFITMLVSFLAVLIVPKIIGVEEYGYWQLFLLYSSYVPILQLGWTDGIYLRYGGLELEKLNKALIKTQVFLVFFSQLIVMLVIISLAAVVSSDDQRAYIIECTAIFAVLVNTRFFFIHLMQATNKMKEYSSIIIIDRVFYLILFVVIITTRNFDFKDLILADLMGKLLSLLYAMFLCREYLIKGTFSIKEGIREGINNILSGSKLLFSNTVNMLILGVVRLGIEKAFNVAVFGKISLLLNISNFFLVFLNAVSLVIYPILKRVDPSKWSEIYLNIRRLLVLLLLLLLFIYYPLHYLFLNWLPQYNDILPYLGILFPICFFDGKMALLVNTYLKAMRKEKYMMSINIVALTISVVTTLFAINFYKNLTFLVAVIPLVLSIRCIIAESMLSKALKVNYRKEIYIECIVVLVFVCLNLLDNVIYGLVGYTVLMVSYILFYRNAISFSAKSLYLLSRT